MIRETDKEEHFFTIILFLILPLKSFIFFVISSLAENVKFWGKLYHLLLKANEPMLRSEYWKKTENTTTPTAQTCADTTVTPGTYTSAGQPRREEIRGWLPDRQ